MPPLRVSVTGLPSSATPEDLQHSFSVYGALTNVQLAPETRSAIVTFASDVDAIRAIDGLNGASLGGSRVQVSIARPGIESTLAASSASKPVQVPAVSTTTTTSASSARYKVVPGEAPWTNANALKFKQFCRMLSDLETLKPRQKLALLFSPGLQKRLENQSWYPIIRLVCPDYDRERPRYGLKDKSLALAYVKALSLERKSPQAVQLISYNDRAAQKKAAAAVSDDAGDHSIVIGDFPAVLRQVLIQRGLTGKDASKGLTIGRINELLDALHDASGIDGKAGVLRELLQCCDAEENYWVARIVVKDMSIGLRGQMVLNHYHPDGQDAMDAHGDLRRVLAELTDKEVRRTYVVEMFHPCAPMLSLHPKKGLDQQTTKLGAFAIEPKLDGDRMLVHLDFTVTPPRLGLFTRNGNDYLSWYGTPQVKAMLFEAFGSTCKRCVVDGEMLVWDELAAAYAPFGHTRTAAMNQQKRHDAKVASQQQRSQQPEDSQQELAEEEDEPPNPAAAELAKSGSHLNLCFVAFDVLLAELVDPPTGLPNGVVSGHPLSKRRALLEHICKVVPHRVQVIDQLLVQETDSDARHGILMRELDRAMDKRYEGIIIKSLSSPYVGGERGRSNGYWLKLKPDYVAGLNDEIECIVLGGFFAEGKSRMSDEDVDPAGFLVGVTKGEKQASPDQFYAIGKVGSGYTWDELKQIRTRLRAHWIRTDSKQEPTHFTLSRTSDGFRPDVWIHPENSIVLSVVASEIVPCAHLAAGFTLRFPRVMRVRWDKPWNDCETYAVVRAFYDQGTLNRNKRAVDVDKTAVAKGYRRVEDDPSTTTAGKRKRAGAQVQARAVLGVDDGERRGSTALKGLEFFVLPETGALGSPTQVRDYQFAKPSDLADFISRHGGKTVPLTRPGRTLYVARRLDESNVTTNNILRASKQSIFGPELVVDIVEGVVERNPEVVSKEPTELGFLPKFRHYLFVSSETRALRSDQVDAYGDPFEERTDARALKLAMREVGRKTLPSISKRLKYGDPSTAFQHALDELLADPDDPLLFPGNVLRGARLLMLLPASRAGEPLLEARLEMAKLTARLGGAQIMEDVASKDASVIVTHVVVLLPANSREFESEADLRATVAGPSARLRAIRDARREARLAWVQPHFVTSGWARQCVESATPWQQISTAHHQIAHGIFE